MRLVLLIALLTLSAGPLMDEYEARLARLEGVVGGQRELLRALQGDAVRSRRFADAAQNEALAARLDPGGLTAQHGVRGASVGRIPALGSPLLARLRDDGMMNLSPGRTDTFDGYSNALLDPTFDTLRSPIALTTSYAAIGSEWEAKYVLNSGTVATTRALGSAADRGATGLTFLSSGIAGLYLEFGTSASGMTIYLRPVTAVVLAAGFNLDPTWLTASIRAFTYAATNVTATAYVELVDASDNVLASGDTEDLVNLYTLSEQGLIAGGYEEAAANTSYRFRLRIDVTKTAGSVASLTAFLAEPLLAFSNDGSAPAFTPAVGAWWPGVPGRQLVQIPFVANNIGAGATTQLAVSDAAAANFPPVPWGGSVVGLSWRFSGNVTGGTYDIDAEVAGSVVFSSNGNSAQGGTATQAPFIDTFSAADSISAQVVTGGGFTPDGTLELVIMVWVLIDYPGT